MPPVDSTLVERSRKLSIMLLIPVVMAACISLSGWVFEIPECKSLFLGRNMLLRASVALYFLLLSSSLLLHEFTDKNIWKRLSSLLTALSLAGASATFVESISAQDFSLNWQIYANSGDSSGITFPGPMPPNVALSIMVLSLALLCMPLYGEKLKWIWQALAILSLVLSLTAFFGYLCGVDSLCTMFGCVRMPCTISVPLTLLSLALLSARPESDCTRIFVVDSLGGKISRRFLTFALAIPLSLSIRSAGCALKLYDEAFGWAVFGMLVFASLTGVVIWSARSLDVLDSARQQAEKKHVEAEQEKENIERKLVNEVAKKIVLENSSTKIDTRRIKNVCLTCTKEYPLEIEYCPDDQTMLIQLPDNSVIGTAFADKYYVIEELGKGGMSEVYKVRHLFLEHQILAIKVLRSHLATDTVSIKRFQHEARTASRLEHPNLLKIHDFGVTRGGQPYLLMDFIKGQSLRQLLAECKRLDLSRFEQLMVQALKGIGFAHKNGVIHRDLKPGNIMIIEQDNGEELLKIVDFGLAKGDQPTDVQLSRTGEIFGSPLYMSPEQWNGQKVDSRSDIYAMGCIMYECLVGTPPFNKETMFELLQGHAYDPVPPIPRSLKIPDHMQETIMSCLAKSAEQRPKTVDEVLQRLRFERSVNSKLLS